MLFLFFFSILGEWGGWVLESMENSILFFFFFLKPSLIQINQIAYQSSNTSNTQVQKFNTTKPQ